MAVVDSVKKRYCEFDFYFIFFIENLHLGTFWFAGDKKESGKFESHMFSLLESFDPYVFCSGEGGVRRRGRFEGGPSGVNFPNLMCPSLDRYF